VTYRDSYQQTQDLLDRESELVDEAKVTYGMLNEAVCKARLLQNQLDVEKAKQEALGEELIPPDSVIETMERLKADFHRYSQRFDEVAEELREIYDELSEVS